MLSYLDGSEITTRLLIMKYSYYEVSCVSNIVSYISNIVLYRYNVLCIIIYIKKFSLPRIYIITFI